MSKNELDKVCFQHHMAYGDFKDLAKRTDSANVFKYQHLIIKHRAFNIDKNPKYDGYQIVLASVVFNFFVKKISGSGVNNEIKQNEQLAEE